MRARTMTCRAFSSLRLKGACLALLTITGAAQAAEDPRAGQLDARVRFVDYRPYQVVRVTGLLRHSIQIEFASDEEILQAAIGNTVAWEIAPASK